TSTRPWSGPRGSRPPARARAVVSRSDRSPICPSRRPTSDQGRPRGPLLPMSDVRAAVASVFREEGGRIVAALIRMSGSFDLAEDALQESLAAAVVRWEDAGIPRNPAAWIMTAARRRLVDFARRSRTQRRTGPALSYELEKAALDREDADENASEFSFPDDRL